MSITVITSPRIVKVKDDNRVLVITKTQRIVKGSTRSVLNASALGGNKSFTVITGASPMSALKVVTHDGRYADHTDPTTIGVAGITVTAGNPAQVQTYGLLTDALWTWTPNLPVFVGVGGAITQTEPMAGDYMRIGEAVDATTIMVRIEPPIIRS